MSYFVWVNDKYIKKTSLVDTKKYSDEEMKNKFSDDVEYKEYDLRIILGLYEAESRAEAISLASEDFAFLDSRTLEAELTEKMTFKKKGARNK